MGAADTSLGHQDFGDGDAPCPEVAGLAMPLGGIVDTMPLGGIVDTAPRAAYGALDEQVAFQSNDNNDREYPHVTLSC